jgi:hypothetical protein
MAGKPGTNPTTYSPSTAIGKTRPPIFKDHDVDWIRPDGRGFQQCRPACTFFSFFFGFICLFCFLSFSLTFINDSCGISTVGCFCLLCVLLISAVWPIIIEFILNFILGRFYWFMDFSMCFFF